MILCIRKRTIQRFFFLFSAVLTGFFLLHSNETTVPAFLPSSTGQGRVLVIDAGHGGEDGGAVALDGSVSESSINLAVALRVNDLMRLLGQPTIMTRTQDISIHSAQAKGIREKKASDLQNRAALVNEQDCACLLSIHQNSLPSSTVTHGAQVFPNRRKGADLWAQEVQNALNRAVNKGNETRTKPIADTIYLMNHITAPGILVECGFLSNTRETDLLQQETYQLRLATAITAGCKNA